VVTETTQKTKEAMMSILKVRSTSRRILTQLDFRQNHLKEIAIVGLLILYGIQVVKKMTNLSRMVKDTLQKSTRREERMRLMSI